VGKAGLIIANIERLAVGVRKSEGKAAGKTFGEVGLQRIVIAIDAIRTQAYIRCVAEENIERTACGSRSRSRCIQTPVEGKLPADVADITYIKRDAIAQLALISEIVILDVRQPVARRNDKEALVRRRRDAAV